MTSPVRSAVPPYVAAVHRAADHNFSKITSDSITLVAGVGVDGDAHAGAQVQHRSRVRADPSQPNLRQVHLIQSELFGEVAKNGYSVGAGDLGENITTAGIDLLALPTGTILRLGTTALIALTGLRNPCGQIDAFQAGLLDEVRQVSDAGVIRKAGVMGVVVLGGEVGPGDEIGASRPPGPAVPLQRV